MTFPMDPNSPDMQAFARTPELVEIVVFDDGTMMTTDVDGICLFWPADFSAPVRLPCHESDACG